MRAFQKRLGLPALAIMAAGLGTNAAAEDFVVKVVSDYENLRMVFEPASLAIAAGDTVTWINQENEEHNVISYPGGFPEGAVPLESEFFENAGDSYSVTFSTSGTYQYHCLPHLLMGMKGEIIVDRRSELEEFHVPTRVEVLTYREKLLEWFDEDDNLMQIRLSEKTSRAAE